MVIRRAASDDIRRVASLLETAGLPPFPSALPLANVLVALRNGSITGVIALQVVGLRGVVWAEAVDPFDLGRDLLNSLLKTLVARAHELSLRELYLLSEKNLEFFADAGFVPVSEESVPDEILSTFRYRKHHLETAKLMRLRLATRFV